MDDNSSKIEKLLKEQNELLEKVNATLASLQSGQVLQNQMIEQIRFSVAVEMQEEYNRKVTQRQLSFLDTLNSISTKRMSFARFGDGEFGLAAHAQRNLVFQRGSHELTERLRNVLWEQRDGLMVGLPGTVVDNYWMTSFARYWGILKDLIPEDRRWGAATVSRAYPFRVEGQRLVEAWRRCWEERRVTVVTGQGSRFSEHPDLFSNATSFEYVYGKPKHAFEGLGLVKDELFKRDLDIVLISLGPAGTVLAADLHDKGIQALDIGHLSNSYEEAMFGGPKPEDLPTIAKK